MIRWIWWSTVSRFFRSSSRAWRWNNSSISRTEPEANSPPVDGKGLDAGGGIACRSADRHEDSLELLLSPGNQKGSALHRANSRANAHCLELALDGFTHREVRRVRNEVAGVEPTGIAGVSEQLARTLGIEWRRLEGQSELETAGHDASGQTRESKGLGVVEGLPVHGEARGQAHPAVVPRRFRVPLLGEVDPERRVELHGHEAQACSPSELLGGRPREQIGDVHLALLQRG